MDMILLHMNASQGGATLYFCTRVQILHMNTALVSKKSIKYRGLCLVYNVCQLFLHTFMYVYPGHC